MTLPDDEMVQVAVPVRHLAAVYALLGELMHGSSATVQLSEGEMLVDETNGVWSEAMLAHLKQHLSDSTPALILDLVAASAPYAISFAEIVYVLRSYRQAQTPPPADRNRVRAEFASLTKANRRLFERRTWPMSILQPKTQGDGQLYVMREDIAASWMCAGVDDEWVRANLTASYDRYAHQIEIENTGDDTATELLVDLLDAEATVVSSEPGTDVAPGQKYRLIVIDHPVENPLRLVMRWIDTQGRKVRIERMPLGDAAQQDT